MKVDHQAYGSRTWRSYAFIRTQQPNRHTGIDHMVVNHNEGEYVNGRIHTNTLEGFWSLLKRMIIGTYHLTSKKHLQKYVDEMVNAG